MAEVDNHSTPCRNNLDQRSCLGPYCCSNSHKIEKIDNEYSEREIYRKKLEVLGVTEVMSRALGNMFLEEKYLDDPFQYLTTLFTDAFQPFTTDTTDKDLPDSSTDTLNLLLDGTAYHQTAETTKKNVELDTTNQNITNVNLTDTETKHCNITNEVDTKTKKAITNKTSEAYHGKKYLNNVVNINTKSDKHVGDDKEDKNCLLTSNNSLGNTHGHHTRKMAFHNNDVKLYNYTSGDCLFNSKDNRACNKNNSIKNHTDSVNITNITNDRKDLGMYNGQTNKMSNKPETNTNSSTKQSPLNWSPVMPLTPPSSPVLTKITILPSSPRPLQSNISNAQTPFYELNTNDCKSFCNIESELVNSTNGNDYAAQNYSASSPFYDPTWANRLPSYVQTFDWNTLPLPVNAAPLMNITPPYVSSFEGEISPTFYLHEAVSAIPTPPACYYQTFDNGGYFNPVPMYPAMFDPQYNMSFYQNDSDYSNINTSFDYQVVPNGNNQFFQSMDTVNMNYDIHNGVIDSNTNNFPCELCIANELPSSTNEVE